MHLSFSFRLLRLQIHFALRKQERFTQSSFRPCYCSCVAVLHCVCSLLATSWSISLSLLPLCLLQTFDHITRSGQRDVSVYSCEKFHQYVYDKKIEIESNHKPLESILKSLSIRHLWDCRECCWGYRIIVSKSHTYGLEFLLCVDYFSKYPEIYKLIKIRSRGVINAMKLVFVRHGI